MTPFFSTLLFGVILPFTLIMAGLLVLKWHREKMGRGARLLIMVGMIASLAVIINTATGGRLF